VVVRACRAVAGVPARRSVSVGGASLLGVLLKKCSNINQKTPPSFTFSIMKKDRQQGELSWDSVIKDFLITAFDSEVEMILKLNRGK